MVGEEEIEWSYIRFPEQRVSWNNNSENTHLFAFNFISIIFVHLCPL